MSAAFDFRDEVFWGSNGSIEVYLEALGDEAAARFGAADPLATFCRWKREA